MSDNENEISPEDDLKAARELREREQAATADLQRKISRVYKPRWNRMGIRRLHNDIGKEYDMSLTPKGRTA